MGERINVHAHTIAVCRGPLHSYLAHVRGVEGPHTGSGYVAGYGCCRALQEAFSGLYFSPHEQRT